MDAPSSRRVARRSSRRRALSRAAEAPSVNSGVSSRNPLTQASIRYSGCSVCAVFLVPEPASTEVAVLASPPSHR